MQNQRLLEQNRLTRDELIALRNKRTGVLIFQISWIMVFVCLILVNLQIRSNFPSWPPAEVQALSPVLPTLATVGLLASAFLAASALRALRAEKRPAFLNQWTAALALGAAFVLVMAFEWVSVPESGQYSTIFRVMTAYHGLHALVIGYIMLRVLNSARAGAYDSVQNWPVEGAAKLWYFVVIAWILFYAVLYII